MRTIIIGAGEGGRLALDLLRKGREHDGVGFVDDNKKLRGKIREAITEYKVIKRFPDYDLVEVFPKTGRTHQIRVHLKAIGHPVVCDKLYGFKKAECPLGLTRQFLHANSLEFTLINGSIIKLEADLPDDLQASLTKLEKGI